MVKEDVENYFNAICVMDNNLGPMDLERVRLLKGLYTSYVKDFVTFDVDSEERINRTLNLIVNAVTVESEDTKNSLVNYGYMYYSTLVDSVLSAYEYETIDERLVNLGLPTLRDYFNLDKKGKEKIKNIKESLA